MRSAVERVDGHSCGGINAAGHLFAGVGSAAETVFGRKNAHHVDAVAQHDVKHVGAIHLSGLIGEKQHPTALKLGQIDIGAPFTTPSALAPATTPSALAPAS